MFIGIYLSGIRKKTVQHKTLEIFLQKQDTKNMYKIIVIGIVLRFFFFPRKKFRFPNSIGFLIRSIASFVFARRTCKRVLTMCGIVGKI